MHVEVRHTPPAAPLAPVPPAVARPPRLWPAVVLLALYWGFLIITRRLELTTFVRFALWIVSSGLFIIAFLVTRFDVTLPIVIWTMLRGGLNPQTNAVGSFIFLCSILMLVAVELLLFRKRRA